MTHRSSTLIPGAAVVGSGLIAGLFFGYACTVMPALAALDDRTFVAVMDRINDAVYNPVFFAALLGAPALIAATAVGRRRAGEHAAARRTWVALGLYGAGMVVTSAVNVPVTDALVAATPRTAGQFAAVRADFEAPFVAGNVARTVLHTASAACLLALPAGRG